MSRFLLEINMANNLRYVCVLHRRPKKKNWEACSQAKKDTNICFMVYWSVKTFTDREADLVKNRIVFGELSVQVSYAF